MVGRMLQGTNECREAGIVGNHGQQTMLWSHTLRGTHNKNVKGLKREMVAKGRDKMWRLAVSRDTLTNSEENTAPYSSSKTPPATLPKSSLRARLENTHEIRGAKKLLKTLNLGEDADVRKERSERNAKLSKKKMGKEKANCIAKQGMTPNPNIRYKTSENPTSPVKRNVSPLKPFATDTSPPDALRGFLRKKLPKKEENAKMSGQSIEQVCVQSQFQSSEDEDDESHVTQWRYKPPTREARKMTKQRDAGGDENAKKLDKLGEVIATMHKQHNENIHNVTENLDRHTRQIFLLAKANSSLADQVDSMQKETNIFHTMHCVCATTP